MLSKAEDENQMFEPYVLKETRTVLWREEKSNFFDLADKS